MSKFKVIEEGRLSKSEMSDLLGGSFKCTGGYIVIGNCMPNDQSYSSCGGWPFGKYESCGNGENQVCKGGYGGPTGPGGNEEPVDSWDPHFGEKCPSYSGTLIP